MYEITASTTDIRVMAVAVVVVVVVVDATPPNGIIITTAARSAVSFLLLPNGRSTVSYERWHRVLHGALCKSKNEFVYS